jgi:hypothetical protein
VTEPQAPELPEGYFVRHYPGRGQPYTLLFKPDYSNDRHQKRFETLAFCASLEEAQRRAWLDSRDAKPKWTKLGKER